MTTEEWRSIPGLDGYEASSLGRVRTWRSRGPYASVDGLMSRPRILTGHIEARGWVIIKTAMGSRKVHALVMLAFVGPRPEGLETRHLDGNKLNNAPANLAYGTHTENMRDLVRHGHPNALKTHCKWGHEFTAENTYSQGTHRHCKTCARARKQRLRQVA